MKNLTKFIIILILVIVGVVAITSFSHTSVDIYIDGENVSCTVDMPLSEDLNNEICNYVLYSMNNISADANSLEEGIRNICNQNGLSNVNIDINTPYGDDVFPVLYEVQGESMVPTLQDGQTIIVEKTKDIEVNDIVVANSSQYGVIVKRVDSINGNMVHLISDNTNVEYEIINGMVYESRGITTWVDISDIYGVVTVY